MKRLLAYLFIVLGLGLVFSVNSSAPIRKIVNVAYFLQWPTPNQEAKVKKIFDKEMGATLKWTSFGNGGQMIEAMLAGDIDIAYSVGLIPFINAAKSRTPITMVGLSVFYTMGGTTCIVSNSSKITKDNAKKLEGKKVAVPLGTMAEFVFDEIMKIVGADRNKMKIIQMDPEEGAAALSRGDVDMTCLFGRSSITKALKKGKRLITPKEMFEAGIFGIDTILVTNKFLKNNRDLVTKFMEVTNQSNNNYKNSKSDINIIAKDAAMSVSDTRITMSGFIFPTLAEQQMHFGKNGITTKWLKTFGIMKDYNKVIDISFIKAAPKTTQIAKKEPESSSENNNLEEEKRKIAEEKRKIEEEKRKIAEAKKKQEEEEKKRKEANAKLYVIGSGTGFFVSSEGHAVSNDHVVGMCRKVATKIEGQKVFFNVLKTDKVNDIGLIKGDYKNPSFLSIKSDGAEYGEDIVAFGYPLTGILSSSVKLTRGIVSSLSGLNNNYSEIQIDAAIQPGNSGGPVLNMEGQVVGVASSGLNKLTMIKEAEYIPENVNFAVAAPTLLNFLKSNGVTTRNQKLKINNTKELAKIGRPATIQLFCLNTKARHEELKKLKKHSDVLLEKVIELK